MKKIIIIFGVILIATTTSAQGNMDSIASVIEANNPVLSALRKKAEAEMLGNKTGIYLQNPEVEFHYLWGDPSAFGNRNDLSITQGFDFPTAYGYRNEISDIKNRQIELEYQKQRMDIMLEVRLLLIDLTRYNALITELEKRRDHATEIAEAYRAKFENGDANVLEYNKAKLNLLNAGTELGSAKVERDGLLKELAGYNGGKSVNCDGTEFGYKSVPADFEGWFDQAAQNNPLLNWLGEEVDRNLKQQKLSTAMSLPKFSAGYMSEQTDAEGFRGVTVGVSIPLWENKNTVKYARASADAAADMKAGRELLFYNRLKALHTRAAGLQQNVNDFRESLNQYDNSELLRKALDKGEITLIDYIMELTIYYESVDRLLSLEKELATTLAKLYQYR